MNHSILKGNLTSGASKGALITTMPAVAPRPTYVKARDLGKTFAANG
jgi:hypothetical protein